MFDNIGGKIKALAKITCWIYIVGFIIFGIITIRDSSNVGLGVVIIVGGILLSWVGSFLLYGFGQLIENSDIIVEQRKRSNQKAEEKRNQQKITKAKEVIRDNNAGDEEYIDITCPNCGEQLSFMKYAFLQQKTLECPACAAIINTKDYI